MTAACPRSRTRLGIDFVGLENTNLCFGGSQVLPAQIGLVIDDGGRLETFGQLQQVDCLALASAILF